nr:MAG TPA: hypothetical protein [Caudoviricetes sp.]
MRGGVSLQTRRRDSLGTDSGPLVIPALVVGVSWVRFPGWELATVVVAYWKCEMRFHDG